MDWKSFLGSGMESYVDTSMKMREAQQPGEWKPQTMQQAIDLKKAGQTTPGYDRAYIVDPQGGYKKIDFPERGRVFAPQESTPPTTPITKNPAFINAGGFKAWNNPNQAKLNPRTRIFINQIKTQEDLAELVGRGAEAKAAGIDVDAILEYFGQRGNTQPNSNGR